MKALGSYTLKGALLVTLLVLAGFTGMAVVYGYYGSAILTGLLSAGTFRECKKAGLF